MILGIYECLDDHHAVTALNLTSRKFYDVWRLHTAIITKAVLPRVIDCFDLAEELAVVQGNKSTSGPTETYEAVLERSKRLLVNAATLVKDHSSYVIHLESTTGEMKEFAYEGNLSAFTESYYRLWILLELFNDREVRDLRLQAATMKELEGMEDALHWLLLKPCKDWYSPFDGSVPHSRWTFEAFNLIQSITTRARFSRNRCHKAGM